MPGPGGTGTSACWQLGEEGMNPPGQKAESPMSPAGKEGLPALLTLPGGTNLPPQNTSWGARLGTRQQWGAPRCLSPWSHSGAEKGIFVQELPRR